MSREHIPTTNEPGWIGIGYGTADLGGILILLATILTGVGMRKLRGGGGGGLAKTATVLAAMLVDRALRHRDLGDDDEALEGACGRDRRPPRASPVPL